MNKSGGPRTTVDSNLFLSGAISTKGLPHRLLQAWLDHRFLLLVADPQQRELLDVFSRQRLLARFRLDAASLARILRALRLAERVPLRHPLPIDVRDMKDRHILAAAFGGEADYLVTGDKDLLVLKDDARLGHLQIVTVAEFLQIILNEDE